jgi:hypothetical protein
MVDWFAMVLQQPSKSGYSHHAQQCMLCVGVKRQAIAPNWPHVLRPAASECMMCPAVRDVADPRAHTHQAWLEQGHQLCERQLLRRNRLDDLPVAGDLCHGCCCVHGRAAGALGLRRLPIHPCSTTPALGHTLNWRRSTAPALAAALATTSCYCCCPRGCRGPRGCVCPACAGCCSCCTSWRRPRPCRGRVRGLLGHLLNPPSLRLLVAPHLHCLHQAPVHGQLNHHSVSHQLLHGSCWGAR